MVPCNELLKARLTSKKQKVKDHDGRGGALTHNLSIDGHDAYSGGSVPVMALMYASLCEGCATARDQGSRTQAGAHSLTHNW